MLSALYTIPCLSVGLSVCTYVVARLSSNVLILINLVTLCRAQLVPGWVTIYGWVNHRSHLGQLSLLPSVGW